MKPMFDNKVVSSFLLWFNHQLLNKGGAHQTCSSRFYPSNQVFNGLYAYASPYNQIVSDLSVTGASVPTGIYLNNVFVGTGTSGFHGYDYEKGRAYFTGVIPSNVTISGRVSFKEFNVVLTNDPEEVLLFETQYSSRPKIGQVPTGLWTNQLSYPLIFLKNLGANNAPFAFGGQDTTKIPIAAIILSDSQFNLDAIQSLFRDQARTLVPILELNEQPYNVYGEVLGPSGYNYTGVTNGKDYAFIEEVNISRFRTSVYPQMREANPNIYLGLMDFVLTKNRYPRQE